MNAVGTKTASRTKTMLMTGPCISSIAFVTASLREYLPLSISRDEFSTTTMASSTTMAIAKTRPNNVNKFMENPNNFITAKVPNNEIGMVSAGMMTARMFCKNKNITKITSNVVSAIVTRTSWMEAVTYLVLSMTIFMVTPSGRYCCKSLTFAFTSLATSKALDPGIWLMPMAAISFPFMVVTTEYDCEPNSILAISLSLRYLPPSNVLIIILPNSSTSTSRPLVLMLYWNAMSPEVGGAPTEPADTSIFCALIIDNTSSGVMSLILIISGSSQTRMA